MLFWTPPHCLKKKGTSCSRHCRRIVRTHAFSIVGPMMLATIWRETFTPVGGADPDLPAIARQHAETILGGLLTEEARP